MTHRPHESWNIVDRPDLPEYELNKACPVTGEVTGLERHHISPRSAGTKSWWVQLEDGRCVGNIVALSPSAHWRVTVNKAKISYDAGIFYWEEAGEKTPLRWQPPQDLIVELETPLVLAPQEGEECLLCKRRVPHKKKASSPTTKVFSCRVPIDDVDEFYDILDGVAEGTGLKAQPHHQYWTLLYGLIALGQLPEGELPRRG